MHGIVGPIPEKTYHSLFLVGIAVKALIGLGEIASGLAFALLKYDTLRNIVFAVFGGELNENPRDFIWELIARGFKDFPNTPQSVWALIFLSHGIVKIFLLIGLWRNKSWAYPASAVIFILFIIYQFYQLIFTPSIVLWLITIIDIGVVLLILREHRHRKNILLAV